MQGNVAKNVSGKVTVLFGEKAPHAFSANSRFCDSSSANFIFYVTKDAQAMLNDVALKPVTEVIDHGFTEIGASCFEPIPAATDAAITTMSILMASNHLVLPVSRDFHPCRQCLRFVQPL